MLNGKMYNFDGKMLELYTIGELGHAIGRDPVTIRKWEHSGLLPRSEYRDNSGRRLYTHAQIMAVRKVLTEENIRSGMAILKTQFKNRVHEEFRILREKGVDHEENDTTGAGEYKPEETSEGKV